jgi:hypothetical protein
MTNRSYPSGAERRIDELRHEILEKLPNGGEWLETPHEFLNGDTPEKRLAEGDYDAVRNLLGLILYIGIS